MWPRPVTLKTNLRCRRQTRPVVIAYVLFFSFFFLLRINKCNRLISYSKENLKIHTGVPCTPFDSLLFLPFFSPPLFSFLPLDFFPLPSLHPFPSLNVFQLSDLGERCKLPFSGVCVELRPKSIWVYFSLKIWHLVVTILMIFLKISCPNFIPSPADYVKWFLRIHIIWHSKMHRFILILMVHDFRNITR